MRQMLFRNPPKWMFACLFVLLIMLLSGILFQEAGFSITQAIEVPKEFQYTRFFRFPAPSPDGKMVAYEFQGHIWVASLKDGMAHRLTTTGSYHMHPVWSTDGKEIAFVSQRNNNLDIYTLPLEGGVGRRITYNASYDIPTQWSADNSHLYFYSLCEDRYPFRDAMATVSVQGGPQVEIFSGHASQGVFTQDGMLMAYTKGVVNPYRKGYRGSQQSDLWIYDRSTCEHFQVTNHLGYDHSPMWSADEKALYYVTDLDGVFNLWKVNLQVMAARDDTLADDSRNSTSDSGKNASSCVAISAGEKEQITFHRDDGVRFAKISLDGSLIVYEYGFDLWAYQTQTGKNWKICLSPVGEEDYRSKSFVQTNTGVQELQVSPDEQQIAFVLRGDIFMIRNDGGDAFRITDHPAREGQLNWHPTKNQLAFVSDRAGNNDVYLVEPKNINQPFFIRNFDLTVTQLSDSSDHDYLPKFSPNGSTLAYLNHLGNIYLLDLETKQTQLFIESASTTTFDWSSDSRWIAFVHEDANYNPDVYFVEVATKKVTNLTQHPDDDGFPFWCEDAKKFLFSSKRIGDTQDIWYVYLSKAEFQKTEEDRKDEDWIKKQLEEQKKKAPPAKEEAPKEPVSTTEKKPEKVNSNPPAIPIHMEDIHRRVQRVTSLPGDEVQPVLAKDGKTLFFLNQIYLMPDEPPITNLWKTTIKGENPVAITTGNASPNSLQMNRAGTMLYYVANQSIYKIPVAAGNPEKIEWNARFYVDVFLERKQKLTECWQWINHQFYDPTFHGCPWRDMYDKYHDAAISTVNNNDFNALVRLMFGELNASHVGIYGGTPVDPEKDQIGFLGLTLENSIISSPEEANPRTDAEGGRLITQIIPNSPCDKEGNTIKVGDRLLKINQWEIAEQTDIHNLLNHTVGEKIQLTIRDAEKGESHLIQVRPISETDLMSLVYDQQIAANQAWVDEHSQQRIGYIHINKMYLSAFYKFETELYSIAHQKDALIIDVRNNSGGWIADYLLATLNVRPHAQTKGRDRDLGYPQGRLPLSVWSKPILVLCNEYSYSNAEIFSHSIKTLKRGKIVGMTTGGGVISTGSAQLIDQASIGIPLRGWYVLDTGMNMELNGCVPDEIIYEHPEDIANRLDRQLSKGVELLLKEIGDIK